MSRRKLHKFAALKGFPNSYTPHEEGKHPIAEWNTRDLPVILELACGTGAYTVELARRSPNAFFIGVDIKGARMWTGAKQAVEEGLMNTLFMRMQIEKLADVLEPASVSEIWITFADPFLAKGKEKKRLTSPRFLEIYSRILQPGGVLHLKTDSAELFDYSLETIPSFKGLFTLEEVIADVYKDPAPEMLTTIQTTYEKSHLKEGRTIRYLRAKFA